MPTRVLISQPQYTEITGPDIEMVFLPLLWGLLKTWFEHAAPSDVVDAVSWLAPLNDMRPAAELIRDHVDGPVDVVGLSAYTWNWHLQCDIARAMKARNPHCLVVAGGPHPDKDDPEFFVKHPYIDVVVVQDGEITFTDLLVRVVQRGTTDPAALGLDGIRGLVLPDGNAGVRTTGPARLPEQMEHSPYLAQRDLYESLIQAHPNALIAAVWETNRGCPFRCSFCDWGSNTFTKVRKVSMDRVRQEISWFGEAGVGYVMCSDANFGMLRRDQEIGELLAETRQRWGQPFTFSYNTAKNNPDRSLALVRTLHDAGLLAIHTLSIQHTSPEVLAAASRKNISAEKQVQVARSLMEDRVDVHAQLIHGMPGDRPELWARCFTDLMEWGIHGHYFVFPYEVLPNAPVNAPESRAHWQLETVQRFVLLNHGLRVRGPVDEERESRSNVLVQTRSYTREDWVRMGVRTAVMKGLHSFGPTRRIAIALRFLADVPYADFYEALLQDLGDDPTFAGWERHIAAHLRRFQDDPDALLFMDVEALPGLRFQVLPAYWLFIHIVLQLDVFHGVVERHLERRYPELPWRESLVHYQRHTLLRPHHGVPGAATFVCDHDWPALFAAIEDEITFSEVLAPPAATPGRTLELDTGAWEATAGSRTGMARVYQWVEHFVGGTCPAGNPDVRTSRSRSPIAFLTSTTSDLHQEAR